VAAAAAEEEESSEESSEEAPSVSPDNISCAVYNNQRLVETGNGLEYGRTGWL
jgi:hypothetical protein